MDKKVYVVTGTIGNCKSTAFYYLKNKGFKTVDLDDVSKHIHTSKQSVNFLKEEFPKALVNDMVDRSW